MRWVGGRASYQEYLAHLHLLKRDHGPRVPADHALVRADDREARAVRGRAARLRRPRAGRLGRGRSQRCRQTRWRGTRCARWAARRCTCCRGRATSRRRTTRARWRSGWRPWRGPRRPTPSPRGSPHASSGSAAPSPSSRAPSRSTHPPSAWRQTPRTSPASDAPEPAGHAPRRRRAERGRVLRQPLAHGRRLVVDDVVDVRAAALDRGDGGRRGVVDVDERELAACRRRRSGTGACAPSGGHDPSDALRGARAVEAGRSAGRVPPAPSTVLLEVDHRTEDPAEPAGRVVAHQRIRLALQPQPPVGLYANAIDWATTRLRSGLARGVDQVARPLRPQAVGLPELRPPSCAG